MPGASGAALVSMENTTLALAPGANSPPADSGESQATSAVADQFKGRAPELVRT